jgi:uncharacterized membrane protein
MTTPTSSTGLDQNIAAALAYFGGVVTGVVFLVIEKNSRYVKFHAMQSTMAFTVVLAISLVLWSIPFVGWLLYLFLVAAVAVVWLLLMFKALNGESYKLPYLGDLAEQQISRM